MLDYRSWHGISGFEKKIRKSFVNPKIFLTFVVQTKDNKNMELLAKKKDFLGTMEFTLKLGKMKKAEDFVTYPVQRGDSGEKVYLQSHHRWAVLNTRTGEIELSARRAQYANSMWLLECKLKGIDESDKATPEQLNEMLTAIRETASPNAGGNNILSMYCDNSNAGLVGKAE